MTTIASLAVFFVTTRLVNISRPTPSTRHVSHPVREPWHGAGASVSVRGDNRRRVDGVAVDAQVRRDGGTQQPLDLGNLPRTSRQVTPHANTT